LFVDVYLCLNNFILNKIYFENINLIDWLVLLPYFVVFVIVLLFSLKAFKIENNKNVIIITAVYLLYNLIFFLDWKFDFVPFLPDARHYYDLFVQGFQAQGSSLVGFYYISSWLSVLFFKNILVYVSFQILIHFLSVIIILKAWELIYNSSTYFRNIFLTLSLMSPAGLLFNLVPLRESFSLFAFAVTLYGLIKLMKFLKNVNWQFLTGLFLVFFTRAQVIVYFVFSLVGLKWLKGKKIANKIIVVFLGVLMLGLFVRFTHHKLSVKHLAIARNIRVDTYTNTYGNVKWQSWPDVFMDAPLLVTQFLLSPMPIMHNKNPLSMTIMLLDAIFVMFLLLIVVFNCRIIFKQYTIWLILIAIYLFLFGLYEFNIGGAVRHRLPMIFLVIGLVASILSNVKDEKKLF